MKNESDTSEEPKANDFELKNLKDSFDTSEERPLLTWTPKQIKDKCDDCLGEWECVECLIKHTQRKHEDRNSICF